MSSHLKRSCTLAWPISLQSILVTLLSMVDVIMVSHLGNSAIAAVGLGNRITFVVQIIIFGLAWGVGIFAAQYFGAGKSSKIRATILRSCILSVIILSPIIVLNYFYSASILAIGSNDPAVINLGVKYLNIVMPSLIFLALILIFENAIRSINHVRIPLIFSSIAIALNVMLNYWLIRGGLGIEALGVEGAAWATFIARLFHITLLLYVMVKIKHPLIPQLIDMVSIKRNIKPWVSLIKVVVPMMFSFGVWAIGTFIYQLMYGQMGTKELAVMSLLTPIDGIYISLFFGFASACSIMIGQQLGANKFDEAWLTIKRFAIYAPLAALIFGLFMLALQQPIFLLFNNLTADTYRLTSDIFILLALTAWLKVINLTVAMGALRAGGDNTATLLIDIIGLWVISLPLTYFVAFELQLSLFYVVLAANSEEVCKAILFIWRLKTRKWQNNLTLNR